MRPHTLTQTISHALLPHFPHLFQSSLYLMCSLSFPLFLRENSSKLSQKTAGVGSALSEEHLISHSAFAWRCLDSLGRSHAVYSSHLCILRPFLFKETFLTVTFQRGVFSLASLKMWFFPLFVQFI